MTIVIVGRTGTGKTRLGALLEQAGLITAKTHATRPPRTPDEDSHYFISKEEADAFGEENKAAVTVINGYEYFTAKEELERCDVIVLDPRGIADLCQRTPDVTLHVVYLSADDDERKFNAVRRADDKIKEEQVFDARDKSEDEQFSEFEDDIKNMRIAEKYPQVSCLMEYHNTFSELEMNEYVQFLLFHICECRRLAGVVRECMDLDIISTQNGKPLVVMEGSDTPHPVSVDYFVDMLRNDDESPIGRMFRSYLMASDRFAAFDKPGMPVSSRAPETDA